MSSVDAKSQNSPAAEKNTYREYEFLPAVLEVQTTPPNPAGRAFIWIIVSLFVFVVVWAYFGKIDIVAIAQGKILPSDRIKVVQPLEIGKVQTIHVQEGQQVKAGDPLITLDRTGTQADVDQVKSDFTTVKLNIIRLQQFSRELEQLNSVSDKLSSIQQGISTVTAADPWSALVDVPLEFITFHKELLREQLNEFRARNDSMINEMEQKQAQQDIAQANVIKLEKILPIVTERVKSLEDLSEEQLVARDEYLQLEQTRIEYEQDLVISKTRLRELKAEIAALKQRQQALYSEVVRSTLQELQTNQRQLVALEKEGIKSQLRDDQQLLVAPLTGTVQQLAVHTVGAVVTPAQELLYIVPNDSQLEVEAFILNKDIGFVEEGQQAEVKIDAFNFTKYGLIPAEIKDISNDAVNHEQWGLVYLARVLLKKSQIQVGERLVNLSPGMSVAVEVKTGKRRLIEFFLSPLLRYKQESIRER